MVLHNIKRIKMKKQSTKQQAKLRAYKKAKIERAEELKKEGKWVCIFTGEPLPDYLTGDKVSVHHLKGRDGELIIDKKFFGFYLNENYHTGEEGIHNKPYSELKETWWWSGYMERLKEIDYDLWYHEKLKHEK